MKVKNATTGEEVKPYAILTAQDYIDFQFHLSNLLRQCKEPVGKHHPVAIKEICQFQIEIMIARLNDARAVVHKSRKKADKA